MTNMNSIELHCHRCENKFTKNLSEYNGQVKKGQLKFYCNLSCSVKSQMKLQFGKRKEEYLSNPKTCIQCNNILTYEKRNYKYCSQSCRSKYFNKNGICNNFKHGKYSLKPCNICGIPTKSIFCSVKCESENDKIKRINKLKNGEYSTKPYSGRQTLRRALFDIRGHKCESCDLSKWQLKINGFIEIKDLPLTVHHIDGNASNNTLENLKLLCWNCHSLTDNYGRKNKNSARNYRYKKMLTF